MCFGGSKPRPLLEGQDSFHLPQHTPKCRIVQTGTQLPPQPMAGRHTEISYNHIHHSGLIGKDTAALYTGGWDTAGLEWHHNWVHTAR